MASENPNSLILLILKKFLAVLIQIKVGQSTIPSSLQLQWNINTIWRKKSFMLHLDCLTKIMMDLFLQRNWKMFWDKMSTIKINHKISGTISLKKLILMETASSTIKNFFLWWKIVNNDHILIYKILTNLK